MHEVTIGSTDIPVFVFVLIGGAVLSLVAFFVLKDYEPPRFFVIFSIFSFLMCVVWLYVIATEIVSVLRVFPYSKRF